MSSTNRPVLNITSALCLVVGMMFMNIVSGQKAIDTTQHLEYLSEISLVGSGQQRDVMMLPEVVGLSLIHI